VNKPSQTAFDVKTAALRILEERTDGVTPQVFVGLMADVFGQSRRWARSVLCGLVADGELAYREQHGHTIIEPSFDRAVRFSTHVVVKPPGKAYTPAQDEIVIRLAPGAAFGTGQHPTTRLSVRGIDAALTTLSLVELQGDSAVLDVGTGSGILAIAALMLGIRRGVGVDIDPCAVDEARRNAALNDLSERLSVDAVPVEALHGVFNLVLANLRYPTLRRILPEMFRVSSSPAAWVFSGIRIDEIRPFRALCGMYDVACRWAAVEKGWAAMVFERP
jgi:ribosomal protein L11 methyltransferase